MSKRSNENLATVYATVSAHPGVTIVQLEGLAHMRGISGELETLRTKGMIVKGPALAGGSVDCTWYTVRAAKAAGVQGR